MRKGQKQKYQNSIDIIKNEINEQEKVREDLRMQIEKETHSPCEFQYLENVMGSRRGGIYRTGNINGTPVMTHDDYCQLIVNESRISQYGKGQGTIDPEFVRPATVYQVRSSGKSAAQCENCMSSVEPVIASDGLSLSYTENSDTTFMGALIRCLNLWAPAITVVRPSLTVRRRTASSLAGIAWVLIFAFILAVPITLSVIKTDTRGDINESRAELAQLQVQEKRLEADYEASIDLREIDAIARNELGMIPSTEASINLLILNPNDKIETFDDEKAQGVLPALLSALGIVIQQD